MEMVWIPAGTFLMGRYAGEQDAHADEAPQHEVTVSRGFWLGKYEVTKAQWKSVMGTTPWSGKTNVRDEAQSPAVYISWNDAHAFASKVSQITGRTFRLPTEAEWEYACRAETKTRFYWGDDPAFNDIGKYAWWRGNGLVLGHNYAQRAGAKLPNAWGLFDMAGNVYEWCQDWHGEYAADAATDPDGPEFGKRRVERGGTWITIGGYCRSACRGKDTPESTFEDLGFRLAASAVTAPVENIAAPEQTDVFMSGTEGVNTYRIPSMIVAPDGTLLVFCEARKESIADASPTDMILRRSLDGGRTWLPTQVLVHGEGNEALMNPCPVIDRSTNTVILFCVNANKVSENHNGHLILTSSDNGKSWTQPADATPRIKGYDDTFVSGPGIGIQTKSGRLVIPGYGGTWDENTKSGFFSRVLYSDDHGNTWKFGAPVSEFSDESQVVELANGRLMLNFRGDMGMSCRGVALSENGGETWLPVHWDQALNECPCQASMIRYSLAATEGKDRLLFANPDNAGENYGVVDRTKMTVRLSYDEGKTWPVKKLIHAGPSSYSSMVRLPDGDVAIVYEGGEQHRREWIRFTRFSLAWLTDGADKPEEKGPLNLANH
jgi:sialidase-1